MSIDQVSRNKSFNGFQCVFKHFSKVLDCWMNFSLYHPAPGSSATEKFNVVFYLSGLTCSEQNFIQKSGVQRFASEHRLLIVGPDTSPRGCNLPKEKDVWDFGEGAGAYVDATEEPWSKHYKMYSYVAEELPVLIKENFPVSDNFGIMGHSMGGHGAMVIGLRNPGLFSSISGLAPICNPSETEWGQKTSFKGYLGEDRSKWSQYDSTELMKVYDGPPREILVDQGLDDEFLNTILLPDNLVAAASTNDKIKLTSRKHEGFDHSYYFVSTFIGDHIKHHAEILNRK